MQYGKRIFALTIVVVLIFALTAPCFSMPVGALYDGFFAAFSAYCASHNMKNVFDGGDVPITSGNSLSRNQFEDMVTDLLDQWQASSNMSNNTLSNWLPDIVNGISFIASEDGVTTICELASTATAKLDEFTNWLLSDVLSISRNNNGNYNNSDLGLSSNISSIPGSLSIDGVSGTYAYPGLVMGNQQYVCRISPDNEITGNVFLWRDSNAKWLNILSNYTAHVYMDLSKDYGVNFNHHGNSFTINSNNPYVIDGVTYYYGTDNVEYYSSPTINLLNEFPGITANSVITFDSGVMLFVRPVDDNDITVPDTEDTDYIPSAISVPLNIDIPTDTADGIDKIIDKQLENDLEKVEEGNPPAGQPTPVISPYLPFNLPSFNFNFSGIWHYVVSWVSSLGSGLAFFSSVWNNIPYAMVVPIYAAAVIVIVTSIFKRFV